MQLFLNNVLNNVLNNNKMRELYLILVDVSDEETDIDHGLLRAWNTDDECRPINVVCYVNKILKLCTKTVLCSKPTVDLRPTT